jgi:next-to-BRCA1 protein 1
VTLKIDFAGDLRRVPMSVPLTMKRLHKIMKESFAALPGTITIVYCDEDGDAVTITRTAELVEAVRHVTSDMGLQTLRLTVTSAPSVTPVKTPATTPASAATRQPSAAADSSWRESKANGATPRAHFVADIAVPDGTAIVAGVPFRKVWKLKNPGPSAWPAGVHLVHVDGADFGQRVGEKPLASGEVVAAGAAIEVALDLIAPAQPGRARGFWRLSTAEGELFGHRIWADVFVSTPCKSTVHHAATSSRVVAPGSAPVVHYGVQCDVTGEVPIVGTRYHKVRGAPFASRLDRTMFPATLSRFPVV